jgi:hypothetical protein
VRQKSVDQLRDVFHTLDGTAPRDALSLRPGRHLVAVYGDGFFSFAKASYAVEARLLVEPGAADALAAADRALLDKRGELRAFEKARPRINAKAFSVVRVRSAGSRKL